MIGKKYKIKKNKMLGSVFSEPERGRKISCIMKECMKRLKCTGVSVFSCDSANGAVKVCFTSSADRSALIRQQECITAIRDSRFSRKPAVLDSVLFQPVVSSGKISAYMAFEGIVEPEELIASSYYTDVMEEISMAVSVLQMQDMIRRNRKTDQLTLLANEIQLREDLKKCRTIENCIFSIVKIGEIDIINRKCGIETGNQVIKGVSGMLREYIKKMKGGVYRFVGNMLAVILFGDCQDIYYKLLDFCALVNNREGIETEAGIVKTHISIGIVEMKNCSSMRGVDDIYANAVSAASADEGGVTFYGERKEKENTVDNSVLMESIISCGKKQNAVDSGMRDEVPRISGDSGFDYMSLFKN